MNIKTQVVLIVALIVVIITSLSSYNKLQNKYLTSLSNLKALEYERDSIKTNNRIITYTIEELKNTNDSLSRSLLKSAKEIGIKDKRIRELYYLKSIARKVDTIKLKDTIFVKDLRIDTTITDNKWYKTDISLIYPDSIVVSPQVISDKHIIVSTKRETVNPPHKFFLFRWFQKKHTVTEVNIVEHNPYIKEDENKFIQVTK